MDSAHNLPLGNAGTWLDDNTKYDEGQTPKLGAIIVWKYADGGAGHVAVVEKINSDGTIVTSNSAYSGTFFYTQTLSPTNNYAWNDNAVFQGFIYFPDDLSGGGGDIGGGGNTTRPPITYKRMNKILLFAMATDRF